jgi:putative Holliday junction resolvase
VTDNKPHAASPEPRGPLLGIDYGTKRVGVSVCDADRVIASPLETYARVNAATDAAHFARLAAQYQAVGLVVGLPLHANGEESAMSGEARAYAKWLTEVTALPAVMWDERCSSHAAEDALLNAQLSKKKRKARVDRVAAQMILQTYLDAKCPPTGSDAPAGA